MENKNTIVSDAVLKEMYSKRILREKVKRCINFIELNGANFVGIDEYENKICNINYDFHGFGIEFTEDEIVFIGEEGDFAHLEIDYFKLLGFMFHMNFISGVGVKRAEVVEEED